MASQPVMSATGRESRANARDDMAVLTSGARHKVDTAMANMQALGKKMLHPMDKAKKADVDASAEQQKKESREKRDMIRSLSARQAESERAAARGMVAKGVEETGGARYPVLVTDDRPPSSHPSQTQEAPDGSSDRQEGLDSGSHAKQPSPSEKPVYDDVSSATKSRNMDRSVEKARDVGDTTEASVPTSTSGVDKNGAEGFDRKVEEGENGDNHPTETNLQT